MQPLHKGHLWLINERLKEGYNVWLVIRDVRSMMKRILGRFCKEIEKMVHEGELKRFIEDGRVITSIML